jgi:hypothetical protein
MTRPAGIVRILLQLLVGGILGITLQSDCAAAGTDTGAVNAQVNVFGLALRSREMPGTINGVVPESEPCLNGTEFLYDALDIGAGYDRRRFVRRIATRNRETSMFGIRPGDPFAAGAGIIRRAGFLPGSTPYAFVRNGYSFTFLVGEDGRIFGMTLELRD